ncbi:hypothetical protein AURDEDRAFT_186743 [Auricularia subglabra TFB-10046 SS5]|nr:hypothetical protein AURDEDRAFT_186743 [Auricularia subglabra TFB-10046 SS5]
MVAIRILFSAAAYASIALANVGFCPGNPVPFYRIVSPQHGLGATTDEHMYTTSLVEVDQLFPRYHREDDCCRVFTNRSQSEGLFPLYRLFTPQWKFDHWYTIDETERNAAIASGKHLDEGVAAWVRASEGCGSTPLYRLYRYTGREGSEDHFYTISKKERDGAVANNEYKYEGIAAYVWANCEAGADFCDTPE